MEIEQIRKSLGDRNLAEVGRRLGVTRAYLQYIRSGKVTSLSPWMHKKISDYLADDKQ
jgi:hypothetical protein